MSDLMIAKILLAVGLGVLPIVYIALCVALFRRRVWWFTYVAYFALFGTIGGLFIFGAAFAASVYGMIAASELFLLTVAVVACVTSSVILTFRKERKRIESVAMICGYIYPACVATFIGIGFLIVQPWN